MSAARKPPIEPQQWDRLKTILDAALREESSATRTALLKQHFSSDTALLEEAESLLAEADSLRAEPDDWIERCAEQATKTYWEEDLSRLGERVGAYVIVRQIGCGGMGAVYLAERADGQFEKQVAIKILKRGTDTEEVLRRFRTERHIVARLEHPNTARLLDAGTTDDGLPYFVMEHVEGMPVTRFVRERNLGLRETLDLFLKVCAAVAAAHKNQIIHRDLKPGNILVNEDREPKLLDFGIAKIVAAAEGAQDATRPGRQHLTPTAASPEQARGDSVTAASDVYALGALLYEMLTGKAPHQFASANPSADELVRALTEVLPPPPSRVVADPKRQSVLRGALDHIVLCALTVDPAARYPSATELADDVRAFLAHGVVTAKPPRADHAFRRWITRHKVPVAAVLLLAGVGTGWIVSRNEGEGRATSDRLFVDKSIAVLPFEDVSGAPENSAFVSGMQDAILTDLGKVADLKVISRGSVAKFVTNRPRNAQEISRALGVAHLLEGRVQRAGNRVRVTATLVDTRSDAQLWAETYERDVADVFAMQSEIAYAIVRQLHARLLANEKAAMGSPATRDFAAYDLYLQAKEIIDSYLDAADPAAALEQAIRFLEEATRRDPKFVSAYAYTARAHSIVWGLGLDTNPARLTQATAAIDTAFSLAPDSAEAHFAKAEHHYRCGLDLPAAETELALARPGLPNSAPFHTLAGNVYRRQARWDEAERSLAKAVELDPRNANAHVFLADTQFLMRKFSVAAATFERAGMVGLDSSIVAIRTGVIEFAVTGSAEKLETALAASPPGFDVAGGDTPLRVLVALLHHDYDAAARALRQSPLSELQEVDLSFYYPRSWFEGVIARAKGNDEEAKAAFADTREQLEARLRKTPKWGLLLAALAQAYAGLGLKDMAISHAAEAVECKPLEIDAYDGPLILQAQALVFAWTNEPDRAMDVIERLMTVPGYLSYGFLRAHPAWSPLRGNERFEKLVASLAPSP